MKYLIFALFVFTVTNLSTCKKNHHLTIAPLKKITWKVHLMDNGPLLKGSAATFLVNGSTGGNDFSGSCTIQNNSIAIQNLNIKKHHCPNKPLQSQEKVFIQILKQTRQFLITGNQLRLNTSQHCSLKRVPENF